MKKQLQHVRVILVLFFAFLLMGNHLRAQVSVTATAATTGPTIYTTVNAAFTAINAGTHQGVILITITANTTEPATPVQLLSSGTGSSSYQSIKIMPSGNRTIGSAATPTASRGILEFIGADSITIDGDDPATTGARNLTIQMVTTTTGSTACLRFSSSSATGNGCRQVTVRNCNITGGRSTAVSTTASYGIFSGLSAAASTITTASGAADNDSMLIENNLIQRCYYGIYTYGLTGSYLMDNLVIRNNVIGSNVPTSNIGFRGIYLANTQSVASPFSAIIEGNDIQCGDTLNGFSTNIAGIDLNVSNAGAKIRNNNIHNVEQPSTGGWRAYGFFISSATSNADIHFYNNMVRDIRAYHYTSTLSQYNNFGIYIAVGVTNLRINNNTIVLSKLNNGTGTINFSACIALNSTGISLAEFRNNILVNKQSDNTGQACVGLYLASTGVISTASIDRNNYFCNGASGYVGNIAAANYQTLANFKAQTLKDSNSVSIDPVFVSGTDLHLKPASKSLLESSGGAIVDITTDMDGDARPGPLGSVYGGGTAYDIGADEADLKLDNMGYDSSSVAQITGIISTGSSNNAILRIPVYVSGSIGTAVSISNFYLNTIGSTTASDITAAKIYYTGSSNTFNVSSQFGSTATSPSGAYTISGTQTLTPGVNYFWLSYDISASATNNNVVDGRVDSITVDAVNYIPASNNPAGNLQLNAPMTYISSISEQLELGKVETGSTNNRLLRIFVRTSSSGAPVSISQLDLNTNGGGNDTTNISNIKVYYTGKNPNFSAINQFGSTFVQSTPTGSSWGTFSITGVRALQNDSNFFWVTYDIKSSAILGDSVDAECTGLTFGSTSYAPSVTAPAGSRMIRAPYCTSAPTNTGDEEIINVQFGSLNNASTCTTVAPGPGSSNQLYSNYTTSVAAPNIPAGIATNINITKGTCGGFYGEVIGVYIDYNQDGIFGTGENPFTSSYATGVANQVISAPITIPCNALVGLTRMRIVYTENTTVSACGSYAWGETEDYMINIVNGPATFTNTTAMQITGTTSAGAIDVPVLRIPVKVSASPCNPSLITEFNFNTAGTTAAGNIVAAKLYKTGNSGVFNNTNLLSTVFSPSGAFTFSVSDTAINDTNNYWLAYDISSSAPNANVVDARFDSVMAFGIYYLPFNGNPTGNRPIAVPMTYLGSDVGVHPDLGNVETNTTNNRMLRIMVRTSSAGSSIAATQFSLNTNGGGNDTTNIANAKIYFTGSSPVFSAINQFGSTYTVTGATTAAWPAYVINGTQPLLNDTNYFWLTYDIKATATLLDSVDAELTGLTIGGVAQTPATSAPVGNRKIRNPYCASAATNTGDEEIINVQFGTLNNASTCTTVAPGPGSSNQLYSNYTTSVAAPSIPAGIPTTINITKGTCGGFYGEVIAVYIDYNQDGVFGTGETAFTSSYSTGVANQVISASITIPCTASTGTTRMRIVYVESTVASACGTYAWGETEDYNINIVNGPATFTNTTAMQITGTTSAGAIDVPVLRIPVKVTASPCNPSVITEFDFNTAGTTAAGNILAAKLYKTGASGVFNNTNLLSTVFSPSGAFTFSVNDTAANDTNNYWLAYDISSSAPNANVVDARFDSVKAFGSYYLPINGNPTGNRPIAVPMTYIGSDVGSHPDLSNVETNSINNRMLRIMVRTSSIGSAIAATQFSLNTNGGGADTVNIANAKIYYTGANPVFSAINQFGSTYTVSGATTATWPAYVINGTQPLLNDTNYFWLTYDIKATATLLDSVDAELTSLTIGGVSQTPATSAPAGSRKIRNPYCPSNATSTADEEIWNVTIGTMNNSSSCTTTGGPGSSINLYSNYTATVAAPNIAAGVPTPFSVLTSSCGGNYTSSLVIYIDFNQDGVFTGTGEQVHFSGSFTGSTSGVLRTGTITIPCNATPGETRMRVIYVESSAAQASCGTYTWGETEDYNINIVSGPATYTASGAVQQTGSVLAGAIDVPILRVPVKVASSSCNPGLLTGFNFSTTGTSTVANILSAKLYKTTGNTFNTSKLLGTVSSPSGNFTFIVTDTTNNDTNFYWLAYDVSSSATNGSTLDARVDSILVFGNYYIPSNGNPTGNVLVSVPMSYVSSTSIHPDLSKVEKPSSTNRMLRIEVQTSAAGASINATSFDFSTNGSAAPLTNISNAKLYYTASSNVFSATTQVGSTVSAPSGSFNISGSQALVNGSNYFWLTYDIPSGANLGDSVDAEVTSITIASTAQTPSVTAPAGSRTIRAPYCTSSPLYTGDEEIFNVTLGAFSNTSTCTSVGPGPGSTSQLYANYTTLTGPTVKRGDYATISITRGTCGGFYGEIIGVYIDYNQNGLLTDAGEDVFISTPSTGSANMVTSGTFVVPLDAPLGTTRLRVVYAEDVTVSPCGTYSTWGETEDYNITVTEPTYDSYTWTGATSTSAVVPTNWSPSRTIPNMTDKLIFNNVNPIAVTAVPSNVCKMIQLTANTRLSIAGTAGNTLTISDSLALGTGSKLSSTSVNFALGTSAANTGSIIGSGRVYGNLSRWFNSTSGSVIFPLTDTGYANRNVSVQYTVFPSAAGTVSARFVNGAVSTTGLPVTDASITANKIGQNGYWELSSTMSSGTYSGIFTGDGFKGVGSYAQLLLLNRTNTAASWGVLGTHVTTTGSNTTPVLSRTGLTDYGQFGIGGDSTVNPLPVSMLYFNAMSLNEDVNLSWATANEINNKGFAIERSVDGKNFKEIGFVKGHGNSTGTLQYNSIDEKAFALTNTTILYYRLRQIDFDGNVEYSSIAMVSLDQLKTDEVKVFPNPFVSSTAIHIQSAQCPSAKVELVDMQGRILLSEQLELVNGSIYYELANMNQLRSGIYFVNVTMNGITKSTKVTKVD